MNTKDKFLEKKETHAPLPQGYLERDWNANAIIFYCNACALKGERKIGQFIKDGNGECIDCFFKENN